MSPETLNFIRDVGWPTAFAVALFLGAWRISSRLLPVLIDATKTHIRLVEALTETQKDLAATQAEMAGRIESVERNTDEILRHQRA